MRAPEPLASAPDPHYATLPLSKEKRKKQCKRQVANPKPIRDKLHLKLGDKIDFALAEHGVLRVTPVVASVMQLKGMVPPPPPPPPPRFRWALRRWLRRLRERPRTDDDRARDPCLGAPHRSRRPRASGCRHAPRRRSMHVAVAGMRQRSGASGAGLGTKRRGVTYLTPQETRCRRIQPTSAPHTVRSGVKCINPKRRLPLRQACRRIGDPPAPANGGARSRRRRSRLGRSARLRSGRHKIRRRPDRVSQSCARVYADFPFDRKAARGRHCALAP